VACALGSSVNPLQNRETQHVNIVLQMYVSIFRTAKYEREIMLEWNGKPSIVTAFSTDFFLPKLGFLEFI